MKRILAIGAVIPAIAVTYYLAYFLPKAKQVRREQSAREIQAQEEKNNQTQAILNEIRSENASLKDEIEQLRSAVNTAQRAASDAQKKSTQLSIMAQQKTNDQILVQYRLDKEDISNLSEIISNGAYGTPDAFCSAAIASRTTRQHAYYMYIDKLKALESRYGKYQDSIEFIGNNLYSYRQILEWVRDQCAAERYALPAQ